MCSTDRRREETTGFKLTYETTHLVWLRIEEIWGRVAIFKSLDIIRFAFQKNNTDYNVENGLKGDKTEQGDQQWSI